LGTSGTLAPAGGKVYIDWANEGLINNFSDINVKDGILTLKKQFIPSPTNPSLGRSGYIVTGAGLNYKGNSPVYIHNSSIYPYNPKINSISGDGSKL
jgi:hypothetical protein